MFFLQLRQLMWKNYLVRSRSKIRLVTEILWPLTIFTILALVRTRGLKEYNKECFLEEKALPSAGLAKFYQTLLCTASNNCYESPTTPLPFSDNEQYKRLLSELEQITATLDNHSDPIFHTVSATGSHVNLDEIFEAMINEIADSQKYPALSHLEFAEVLHGKPLQQDKGQYGNRNDLHTLESLSSVLRRFTETPVGQVAGRLSAKEGDANNSMIIDVFETICGKSITFPNITEDKRARSTPSNNQKTSRASSTVKFDPYLIDLSPEESGLSETCSELFSKWQNNSIIRPIFTVFYPFIRGKLVYSPHTAAFDSVIHKVNETFQDLGQVKNVSDKWLNTISPTINDALTVIDTILYNVTDFVSDHCRPNRTLCEQILGVLQNITETVSRIEAIVDQVDMLANFTSSFIDCYDFDKFIGFSTEEEAVSYGVKLLSKNLLWAVIVFDETSDADELPPYITYKIRMDKFKVDDTSRIKDYTEIPIPRTEPLEQMQYFSSGFIFLQDRIERAIIQLHSNQQDLPQMYTEQIPSPCSVFDQFLFGLGPSFPLFMNLAFVFACAMIVKSIVHEKERRLKETMRTMGLGNGVHWVAWFIDSMFIMIVVCIILPIILYFGSVLERSNPTVVFVFLLSFCMANVTFSFLISTFFSQANLAAACGAFIYFICYQPYALIDTNNAVLSLPTNILVSLISNIVFGIGNAYLIQFEEIGIGAHWYNIATSPIEGDPYSLLGCILMQFADAVIYMLIALYIEAVFPGMYGVPKPWYFVFQPSFWCPNKKGHFDRSSTEIEAHAVSDLIEAESRNLPVGVSIRNLSKTFSNGKQAVKSLNLDFYQNQITSFLGHNGAGKTTTISILTGLFPPTTGTAVIDGYDIRYQMDDIRQQLGLCPQFNVLFDQLTVVEHLVFYANLKTGQQMDGRKEIDQMIEDLGLSHKRDEMSRHLSGGMKRKLSIGAAFIGNSKTVILDEPTAGVDPYSRRSIWEILLKYKTGRTIILTTHFMDEADLLGDRIAIISQGQLKCCGSSLFLKRKLGSGYYLTLVRKDENNQTGLNNLDQVQSELIHDILNRHIPNNFIVQDVGTDLVICLPEYDSNGSGQRHKFPKLFQELESKLDGAGLDSYGISDTTLEEIFLKVANDPSDDLADLAEGAEPANTQDDARREENDLQYLNLVSAARLTGAALIFQQILALYIKRFCNSKRNLKGFFCEIILPALVLVIAELFASGLNLNAAPPPLVLSPWLYGDSNAMFYANRNPTGAFTEEYVSNMINGTGLGVRCLASDPLGLSMNCSNEELGLLNPGANPNDYHDLQCPCELGVSLCPVNSSQGELWKYGSVSTDEFYDLSENNIPLWILQTYKSLKETRFGGYEFGVHLSDNDSYDSNVKVWYENKAWASSVAYLNAINNVILRSHLSSAVDPYLYGITAINHPLDFSNEHSQSFLEVGVSAAFAITVIFSLSFVPASFVIFLVEERVSKAKHLQFVSGVKPITFWTASYTWDLVNYIIPCFILILIFLAFGQWEYVGSNTIGGMMVLLILFGVSSIPLMYPASLVFSVSSTAFVALACANLFVGTISTIASFILQLFDDPGLNAIGEVLDQVFLIFPHFCLGRGMIDLAQLYYTAENYKILGIDYWANKNVFDWIYLGRYCTSLAVQAMVFFVFNLLLHYQVFPERGKKHHQGTSSSSLDVEDEDVARERARVEQDQNPTDELRLLGLTKIYGKRKKPATDRLSFGLKRGECFGLLGVNGAGKSTTFKMLTGDESVTSGNAFVGGYSILTNLTEAQQSLGYCPQEDALLSLLTGKEHLELFARLRGVPKQYIKRVVGNSLKKLSLLPYKNRNAGTYSGGNKRKLATAIALIGNPSVVFLDEPSSGMDPRARRSLWQAIIDAVKDERSVLLTSHSMEECQVLCTRLAIMVNGTLRCLGSAQHLKNRFGDGYMINVRCEVNTAAEVLLSVQAVLPEATLREQRPRQLIWHVKPNVLPISALFGKMETARQNSRMLDYSITQTTLDDVFVRFARLQREINEEIHESASISDGSSVTNSDPEAELSIL